MRHEEWAHGDAKGKESMGKARQRDNEEDAHSHLPPALRPTLPPAPIDAGSIMDAFHYPPAAPLSPCLAALHHRMPPLAFLIGCPKRLDPFGTWPVFPRYACQAEGEGERLKQSVTPCRPHLLPALHRVEECWCGWAPPNHWRSLGYPRKKNLGVGRRKKPSPTLETQTSKNSRPQTVANEGIVAKLLG